MLREQIRITYYILYTHTEILVTICYCSRYIKKAEMEAWLQQLAVESPRVTYLGPIGEPTWEGRRLVSVLVSSDGQPHPGRPQIWIDGLIHP